MTRSLRGMTMSAALLAVLPAFSGCGEGKDGGQAVPAPQGSTGAPPAPVAGREEVAPTPTSTTPAEAGASPTIKAIMGKLTKGHGSLTPVIGEELHADPLPWETIQAQTREYAQLAAALGQDEPPKGSKESWAKLTGTFSETAAALDRAAQAKDKDAALEAHDALESSCMACHREHRVMGPGGGMPPGGFGPRGGPPGGGPPGGRFPDGPPPK
jgi:cytochrome c556